MQDVIAKLSLFFNDFYFSFNLEVQEPRFRIDVEGAGDMPHGCSHDANVMSQNLW